MDTVYNYQNYEIIIKKCSDSIYIQFLDKQLFKIYSNTFIDIDVIRFNMTLNIFYKIMITVFESIIEEDDDMATLEIFPSMNNLKLSIHHKFHLKFIFELELNLIKEASLSAKDICIKKLEQKIDTLQKEHDDLKKQYEELKIEHDKIEVIITDTFMETLSYSMNNNHYTVVASDLLFKISKNTFPDIKIHLLKSGNVFLNQHMIIHGATTDLNRRYYQNKINNNIYVLYTSNNIKYNNNFKNIKCHTLIIESNQNSYNFGYKNLPLSIITLIIEGDISTNNFKELELPNLETIKFQNCKTITCVYDYLVHLKSLKNIIIKNCPIFQERALFLMNGYNFKIE